jgi:hypothetical protein
MRHPTCQDQRARLLVAALGFAGLPHPSFDRALWALRTWLDSWCGIGDVVHGMARQGFDLHDPTNFFRVNQNIRPSIRTS